MKLSSVVKEKLDESLCHKLTKAKADDRVQVVYFLQPLGDEIAEVKAIKPSDFSRRKDFRLALIDQQPMHNSQAVGKTIQGLKKLTLNVKGGNITRAVVAEGPARLIADGASLPGVRSAVLDSPLTLPKPRKAAVKLTGSKRAAMRKK